jgi:hypothetical protein
MLMGGDNSNTQFALLGVWVGQRNGAPVQPSLAFVERYFRTTTASDGGWNYTPGGGGIGFGLGRMGVLPSTPSMTCAGLLGLAVGHGVAAKMADDKARKAPVGDAAVTKGFKALEAHLKGGGAAAGKRPLVLGFDGAGHNYYLFWSIERVAMIYNIQKLAGKDWYAWLSKLLIDAQKGDGSWSQAEHDNCFALLVLRRANVAKDLTQSLGAHLTVKDLQIMPEKGKEKDPPANKEKEKAPDAKEPPKD